MLYGKAALVSWCGSSRCIRGRKCVEGDNFYKWAFYWSYSLSEHISTHFSFNVTHLTIVLCASTGRNLQISVYLQMPTLW